MKAPQGLAAIYNRTINSEIIVWPPLPDNTSPQLLGFLITNNMLLIIYAMIVSSIIANAKTAVWCGATLWIASYSIFSELLYATNFVILKPKIITAVTVFFNNMLPNGLIDYFEEDNKTWEELMQLHIIQFLILTLYGCVLKCVDHFKPGRYVKLYGGHGTKSNERFLHLKPTLFENNVEYGPLNTESLELTNVSAYCSNESKKNPALKNVSMKFFKNEISVILGPNSSGKTSLISILAGWQTYEGHIAFRGHDIGDKLANYSQEMDVSMPNNPLFDRLTLKETLEYFITLKLSKDNRESERERWLKILVATVTDHRKLVKSLSFGEKRLLSLCCTLAGKRSVILLDEPTAHMKSQEQTRYWDILKQEKMDRIIIVTTFSIDEATEIADRIAILNEGFVRAWGTSYYLRNKFGVGFYLVCFVLPMTPIKPITLILEKFIKNVKIHNQFIDRVIYIIPADKKHLFQSLLIELEKDFNKLGIINIYMCDSSLNDVYMALTMKQETKIPTADFQNNCRFLHEKKPKLEKLSMGAILYKKLICQAKNSLPIFIVFLSCFLILAFQQMSLASVSVDRIMFSVESENEKRPTDPIYTSIQNIDNVNGLFRYRREQNDYNVYVNNRSYRGMAAVEIKKPNMSMWFNEGIFHSAPLALNLLFSYLLNGSTVTNKPITLKINYDLHIIMGIIMPLTMSVAFVLLQDERSSNMMILQKIAGLKEGLKWMASFLWDYFINLLTTLLYIIMIITFVMEQTRWQMIMAAFLLFSVNGLASILFVYLMSLLIREDSKCRAFFKIFLLQLFLGLLPYIFYINILQNHVEFLFYAFMISHGFSVLRGTTEIFNNNKKLDFISYFGWHNPGIMDSICCILLTTVIYLAIFVATIIYRKKQLQSIPKKVKAYASVCYPYDEDHVVKEKVRISNMNIKACRAQAILVDQLESKLPKHGIRVNVISFALDKHSCLGIYGSSHSGKTHLLKQLIGEKGYWFGEVYIAGFNCKKQQANALQHLGYCPQTKGFNNLLTPREIFTFFLMLNGVNATERYDYIRNLSATLQLRQFMNYRIQDLPTNIKRRLNVAVALIAYKEILIFDEPTRGLPAYDRLLIWDIIKYSCSLGNTIIFTTNDSLELKELAHVVAVVNESEMLAYNSPHNVEHQYNVGFYLEIKLYADGETLEEVDENLNADVENLNRFITFFHEDSEMIYQCGSLVKYYIPVEEVVYSLIFGSIEKNRNRLNIADYTLTAFSLTNVLRLLQKLRKEKRSHVGSRMSVLKDAKLLPKRD